MEYFLLIRVCNQLEDTGTAVSSVANVSGESKIREWGCGSGQMYQDLCRDQLHHCTWGERDKLCRAFYHV